jgi:hypothetical protein
VLEVQTRSMASSTDSGYGVSRRKFNPDWASGKRKPPPPSTPGEFERYAAHLGVSQEHWADSEALRKWCEQNRDRIYVPEWLLKHWGIPVDPNLS